MLDLLAAISAVDPTSLLAWLILAFAAGMYPVGIMLGSSCSPCCNACGLCNEGALPETLTVTFGGLADQTPGPDLITLSFSACYGGGAAAQVTAPGGDPATDKGPISAAIVTAGGSGYAKLGRVAPTLTVSGGSGTGATFTPSLSTSQDGCDLDLWALGSVAASGGTGYEDGDTLTITVAAGDTEVSAAAATLFLDKTEPTLTLDGGATATVTMAGIGNGNYRISAVSVTGGGSGYSEGQALTFSVGVDDETVSAATATARVVHDTPENALLYEEGSGSGAVLTPVWTLLPSNLWPAPHKKTYSLSAVTITNGGSGYSYDDLLEFYFASNADGDEIVSSSFFVDAVDGSGAITAVFITNAGGRYVGSRTDALYLVQITSGGSYYHDDPGASRVFVDAGGSYYREDADEEPYVATVTVSIAQSYRSAGTGASLSVTIDDDTSSETFGEITGITIDDGGDDYLAHELFDTCMTRFDGRSIVVKRSASYPCLYEFNCAWDFECGVERETVFVQYNGPSQPLTVMMLLRRPTLNIFTGLSPWTIIEAPSMTADELSPDCSDIDVTATGGTGVPEGATAHIVAGGEYEETETCLAFPTEEVASVIIEASWAMIDTAGTGFFCGKEAGVYTVCDGTHIVTEGQDEYHLLAMVALELAGCEWRWVGTTHYACGPSNVWVFKRRYAVGGYYYRDCEWEYPVISVPVDEDGLPSGEAVLGEPVFTTFVPALVTPEPFPVDEVCVNPGLPTVTFSRLP